MRPRRWAAPGGGRGATGSGAAACGCARRERRRPTWPLLGRLPRIQVRASLAKDTAVEETPPFPVRCRWSHSAGEAVLRERQPLVASAHDGSVACSWCTNRPAGNVMRNIIHLGDLGYLWAMGLGALCVSTWAGMWMLVCKRATLNQRWHHYGTQSSNCAAPPRCALKRSHCSCRESHVFDHCIHAECIHRISPEPCCIAVVPIYMCRLGHQNAANFNNTPPFHLLN